MSDTPIFDFAKAYAAQHPARFHMPGHKGAGALGSEKYDLTEIDGADALFEGGGIIGQSEKNASALFGCPTFYSTEGSSLCVRAMLYLAATRGKGRRVLAARNVHKSFVYAAALLGLEVSFIECANGSCLFASYGAEEIVSALEREGPGLCCLFLTMPDYLGAGMDLLPVAQACRRRGVLLLVDCAHGAYLHFDTPSFFPIDRGADLVCSSAHKTLPVLTGGAYLHISPALEEEFSPRVKDAMALFASTSPSYLILESLDAANVWLKDAPRRFAALKQRVFSLRASLMKAGFDLLCGKESEIDFCKVTLMPKSRGCTGHELAAILMNEGIYPEFHDPDYLVLMVSAQNRKKDFERLERVLGDLPRRAPIETHPPKIFCRERSLSFREALFASGQRLPLPLCEGRILRDPCVSCPPAVPILMSGERITREALDAFAYYGVKELSVVEEER